MSSRSTDQFILAQYSKEVVYNEQDQIKKKYFEFHGFYWDCIRLIGSPKEKEYVFNQNSVFPPIYSNLFL